MKFQVLGTIFLLLGLAVSVEAQQTPARFQTYGDADVLVRVPDQGTPTFAFAQNHASVFLSLQTREGLGVQTDLIRPNELFQLTIPTEAGTWTLGRILLPFGLFDMHHLYGGQVDEDGIFLPKLWTDVGIAWSAPAWGPWKADVFATNGMDPSNFASAPVSPVFSSQGTSDADLGKALGARLQFRAGDLVLAASGSWDPFGTSTSELSYGVGDAGFDAAWDLGGLLLKAGGLWQTVQGSTPYQRWADYVEAKYKLDFTTDIRLRAGQMDPNTLYVTADDQYNANAALLLKFDAWELDLIYSRNWTAADPAVVGQARNFHEVLVKVLIAL